MTKLIAVLAVLAALLLTGAKCGSGASGGDSNDPNKYVNTPSTSAPAPSPSG